MLEEFTAGSNGKTVPEGSPMKEAWQMILRQDGNAARGTVNCWNHMYNKKVITKKWQNKRSGTNWKEQRKTKM